MEIIKKYHKIIKYGIFSVLSLVVDASVFMLLFNKLELSLLVSNTVAMCVGFVVQFVLASKQVFGVSITFKTLLVYILTTLLGFGIANLTIYVSFYYIFIGNEIISKLLSVVLPFFVMYFLRKFIFDKWFTNDMKKSAEV